MVQSAIPVQGTLRVVGGAQLTADLQRQAEARVAAENAVAAEPDMSALASHIRTQYNNFRRHRDDAKAGWSNRLLSALRAFKGEYEPEKLNEIKKFGGSEIYARLIAMKARGASALLRDVYLAPDRSWGINPPADPDVPAEVVAKIQQLIQVEMSTLQQMGQPMPDPGQVRDRMNQLFDGARQAEKKHATRRAKIAEQKIDEILSEGMFYKALAEFLVDLPLFPFACIKGPTVRIVPSVSWDTGVAVTENKPKMFWARVSPFDLFFTPGVSDIEDADVIEKSRLTRGDLNDLLDLPGYRHDDIRAILEQYGRGGINDDWDSADTERAQHENRENPTLNNSGLLTMLEFHGNVQGRMLMDYGFTAEQIPDELRDYFVQAWMIGRYVIKVQLSPSPRKRHPYFITSFEKVPGTPVGNGLPDILADVAEAANATLRALVNNLSMASGPQVEVNMDRIAPGADPQDMFPWKRWFVTNSELSNTNEPAIKFFQPNSHSQEMLGVFTYFNNMADDLSAIPKYQTGSGATGGAGRTAAGLAMLMGNASKLLQTVAANIDRDVFEGLLNNLFDMLMLTDQSGILRGDEHIRVMGVNVAIQRETLRSRQLEFLSITANPIDTQIMGPHGRAKVLRAVSSTIGLDGEDIVPDEDKLNTIEAQQNANPEDSANAARAAQGGQQPPSATQDMGPRVTVAGGQG